MIKFLPLLALATLGFGCHDYTPQAQRAQDVFECRVAALSPYLSAVFDVSEVVRDTIQGKADPVAIMSTLGLLMADIHAAAEAWNACSPQLIVAPPPAYGDKVVFLLE